MGPVIASVRRRSGIDCRVCVSRQHREMLDQVLRVFQLTPDDDLDVMAPDQTLNGLAERVMSRFDSLLTDVRPDRVIVHGDTTTAMAGALAAFHRGVPVAHVEAGLRTYDLRGPFPEEYNRRAIDLVADLLFAPTPEAAANLAGERLAGRVVVTGNTVVDSLVAVEARLSQDRDFCAAVEQGLPPLRSDRPLLLVTCHRRENFGEGLNAIVDALDALATGDTMDIVLPVHRNPNVRTPIHARLAGRPGLHLVDPLDYPAFVSLLLRAAAVLTDSGGVQEEAASLGKPLLIMREATERPEALAGADAVLVGADPKRIVWGVRAAVEQGRAGYRLNRRIYGDGQASERIADVLCGVPVREFGEEPRARLVAQ